MLRALLALFCATVTGCIVPGESCYTQKGDACDHELAIWCGAANIRCTIDEGARVGRDTDEVSLVDGSVVHIEAPLAPERTELTVFAWRGADNATIDPLRILVTVDGVPLERIRPDRFRLAVSELRRARIDVSLAPNTSEQRVTVRLGLIKKQQSCRTCDL